jgi:hypothetical protein
MVNELLVHDGLLRHRVQRPVEEEGMRADFSKLHDRVLQLHVVDFRSYKERMVSMEPRCGEKEFYF